MLLEGSGGDEGSMSALGGGGKEGMGADTHPGLLDFGCQDLCQAAPTQLLHWLRVPHPS